MVQVINDPYSGNIFGRIGKGIGQGLSEQIPKEIDRYRLASGLTKLQKEDIKDPFDFFTKAISIPGITPQMVQSLAELSKQRLRNEAANRPPTPLETGNAPKLNLTGEPSSPEGAAPSITTRAPLEATIEPYIRPSGPEIDQMVKNAFNENPAYFGNDIRNAEAFVERHINSEEKRNADLINKRTLQQGVQNTISKGLSDQNKLLGNIVPPNVYSKIENEAINAIKSISEGGEGLTEQQAAKKYGDQLQDISKDYSDVRRLGNLDSRTKNPKEVKRALGVLQKRFMERGDQENLAENLQSENSLKLSAPVAYHLAYPVSQIPELESYLKSLPNVAPTGRKPMIPLKERQAKTLEASKKIASLMGKIGSPLSIAEELANLGYDADIWLKYLEDNRKDLDLSERQGRELSKTRNFIPNLNDLYLFGLLD